MNKLLQNGIVMLAASAFLLACSDDSSDDFGTEANGNSCKVIKKDPFVIETVEDGFHSTTTFVLDDGDVVKTVEFDDTKTMSRACSQYEKDSDYRSVRCEGKTIVAIGEDEFSSSEFKRFVNSIVSMCEDIGDDGNSSSSANSSSSEKSSSSVASSSSSEKSSSSVASSSSEKSSSSVVSSSSVASSSSEGSIVPDLSSSSVIEGNVASAQQVSYYLDKVVAVNADSLECAEENGEEPDLDQYDIAYEFNMPDDLGRDYIGNVHAYQDVKVSNVYADCGSIVLNGSNGLIIPDSKPFQNKGFVLEVRFMMTGTNPIANLVAANPPGQGIDGWQLRVDNSNVVFYYRDGPRSGSSWNSIPLGTITSNEWHVARIKLFPAKSELDGEVFYTFNASLDGSLINATSFNGDLSQIQNDVGIGYDAVYQDRHNDRTFIGKIDYIRYGKISEDNL